MRPANADTMQHTIEQARLVAENRRLKEDVAIAWSIIDGLEDAASGAKPRGETEGATA
jgi:hypothetical protein